MRLNFQYRAAQIQFAATSGVTKLCARLLIKFCVFVFAKSVLLPWQVHCNSLFSWITCQRFPQIPDSRGISEWRNLRPTRTIRIVILCKGFQIYVPRFELNVAIYNTPVLAVSVGALGSPWRSHRNAAVGHTHLRAAIHTDYWVMGEYRTRYTRFAWWDAIRGQSCCAFLLPKCHDPVCLSYVTNVHPSPSPENNTVRTNYVSSQS